ncbi:MAG: anhydro-N-acetylmuramic acid kinase [Gammaproteobacteria bacterium]|nr:anhydro-N-acetylmuramic acid kinase [Gammaproteobacteria bacterium]
MNSEELYIGLMSGTSIDSIDAALVSFYQGKTQVLGFHEHPIPSKVRLSIESLCLPGDNEIDRSGSLSHELGLIFADAALTLLSQQKVAPGKVLAIGSHGQTIRHRPQTSHPFTLQIGDPSTIAYHTGITTVADFRSKDIAAGGQGAPLVPAFHSAQFHHKERPRIILNIGGIANITRLPADNNQALIGLDTGPGNTLMDYWCNKHLQRPFDNHGLWARSGHLDKTLLDRFLQHQYFQRQGPKSTGREEFSSLWLNDILQDFAELSPETVQCTLCELSAQSISNTIKQYTNPSFEIIICGGGAKNKLLTERLKALLPSYILSTSAHYGISIDAVEAAAFAWLAQQTLKALPGSRSSVTGAKKDLILGGIYPAG